MRRLVSMGDLQRGQEHLEERELMRHSEQKRW